MVMGRYKPSKGSDVVALLAKLLLLLLLEVLLGVLLFGATGLMNVILVELMMLAEHVKTLP